MGQRTDNINRFQVQVEEKEEEIKYKGRQFSPDSSLVKKSLSLCPGKKYGQECSPVGP